VTDDDLIAATLIREGGYRNVPGDAGGPTNFGITAASWGRYLGLIRPATAAEVQAITHDQAVAFYRAALEQSPFRVIASLPLRVQLWDFGVNSSDARALRWLQRLLQVPVSGTLDDRTLRAITAASPFLLNEALVGARARMLRGGVKDGSIPASDQNGLLDRAFRFSQIVV
jgi:lysozyme family protein